MHQEYNPVMLAVGEPSRWKTCAAEMTDLSNQAEAYHMLGKLDE
jgi:hypothetical protein